VSSEPTGLASCLKSVEGAVGDLRSEHGELASFFSDVFDQLESLMLDLFGQHKWVESRIQYQAEREASRAEYEEQFRASLEELRDLEAKVRSAHEGIVQIWPQISGTYEKLLQEHAVVHETREEIRQISSEFRTMREGVERDRVEVRARQESIQEELQRLARIVAEPAAAPALSDHNEQLSQILDVIREQQVAWQQDRARLESELEAERQRAAQQDELLAEQRRLAAQQQAEVDGQLKRMRLLLDVVSKDMHPPFDANSDDQNQTSSMENGALGSAFSQFQMLARDHAQRRAGRNKDTAKQ